MSPITTARIRVRPPFVMRNGRYVRDNNATEIVINSGAKGNSLSKFPAAVGRISHHKWS